MVLKKGGKSAFTEPNMMNPRMALQKIISFLKREESLENYRWKAGSTKQK
jgi:hypothetical protein